MSEGLWVVQVRNDEQPGHMPVARFGRTEWDTRWHTIDERAFASWDTDAFNRAFEMWQPMEPTGMDHCVEAMSALRRKWEAEKGDTVARWQLLNVITGEIIPQEIFTV